MGLLLLLGLVVLDIMEAAYAGVFFPWWLCTHVLWCYSHGPGLTLPSIVLFLFLKSHQDPLLLAIDRLIHPKKHEKLRNQQQIWDDFVQTNGMDGLFVMPGGTGERWHAEGTALHKACSHFAPLELIRSLVEACPEALGMRGFCDYLPLHYLCHGAPSEMFAYVMRQHPAALRIGDFFGRTPLIVALEIQDFPSPIPLMLQQDPEAAGIGDFVFLPLHTAVRELQLHIYFSMQIIIGLIRAYPEAVTTRGSMSPNELPVDMFQGDATAKETLQAIMTEAAQLVKREKAVVEQLDSLLVSGLPTSVRLVLLDWLVTERRSITARLEELSQQILP
jgi:hypothetical protein